MHESIMEQLWQTSHLQGGNLAYVEQLFETYLTDPNAVPEEWRSYFDKLPSVDGYQGRDIVHSTIRDDLQVYSFFSDSITPSRTYNLYCGCYQRYSVPYLCGTIILMFSWRQIFAQHKSELCLQQENIIANHIYV